MSSPIARGALVVAIAFTGLLAAGCGGSEQATPAATVAAVPASGLPTVGCDESIGGARFSGTDNGARIVLATVSVPPARLPEPPVASGDKTWPYVAAVDLVVRSEQPPAEIVVPKEWRERVALTIGGQKLVDSLQIATCPNNGLPWNAFSAEISLTTRTACVPLTFRVGGKAETVRFGIGRGCPPGA